jgi:hypothetical protein
MMQHRESKRAQVWIGLYRINGTGIAIRRASEKYAINDLYETSALTKDRVAAMAGIC